ncbi:lipopolysaccharide heptosyltransferase II [Geothrix rubra]|uniref:Lipopolysaccharide heptosyltransferase II n=1 Tax=Geothrix rubra TaxID=2927977 RepID=A0ABQ5Q8N7_9BACT|nr:glycosyltransferase family 9 protein [Geothrix rubra]GLH71067.1 lipopolysaccharide heptosyltransferase II [Geothrix rubra]
MIPDHATWVRFPRFVGDAAMQLPVLRLLREIGEGPIVVWGPKAAVGLVEGTGLCDATVPDEGKPGPWAMARLLRKHRAARSIHFPKSLRPALAAWLARVPERIGVDESLAGPFNTHSGPFWKADGPFLLRYHAVLKRRWPDLPPMPFADFDPGVPIDRPAQPYLCLMPGSTWASKAWPAESYRMILLRARVEGFAVAVLGSPDEAAVCAAVAGTEGIDLCGRTTLQEAAAWLRGARGALGNDSGLSHLAAACGAPTLAIYGATDPRGSTPWGPRSRGLRRNDVPCAPCFLPVCAVEGHPCLTRIGPDETWKALMELISA